MHEDPLKQYFFQSECHRTNRVNGLNGDRPAYNQPML